MLEIPGYMQATLVSHYGEKPSEVAQLIRCLQDLLAVTLKSSFRPYQLEQVHGTLIGLEGDRIGRKIRNRNSADLGICSDVDPVDLLNFLRRDDLPAIHVRVGGYRPYENYFDRNGKPIESRGMHPYLRSFSIQGEIAVAMGWPVEGSVSPDSLDKLRWDFLSQLGIRHKWHKKEGDRDNDFFFVLGRLDRRQVDARQLQWAAEQVRLTLAGFEPLILTLSNDTLRVVGWLDPQLPADTSCAWAIKDPALTADRLLALYPQAEQSETAA